MEYKRLDDIRVQNRIRKHFEEKALGALADDIASNGLLHAIALDPSGALVAGERRLRACTLLSAMGTPFTYAGEPVPAGHIPTISIAAEDPDTLLEIELNENLMRENLTWQERVAAEASLHNLRLSQNPSQTLKDTAQEIKGSEPATAHDQTKLSSSVKIAKFLDDPEVRGAQTERIALRLAERKAAEAAHIERKRSTLSPSSPHTITQGDSFKLLEALPDGIIDCICTDPPYGIGADNFNNPNTLKHAYKDDEDYGLSCYATLAVEGFRVAKQDAALFTFLDITLFERIKYLFEQAGWKVWKKPFIWYKGSQGYWPDQNYGPRYSYETILYARKGNRRVLECANDVIDIPARAGVERQAAKPPALYHNLLKRVVLAGDKVLDPFCGSGPIVPAANTLSASAICFDLDPEAIELTLTKQEMTVNEQ